MTEPEQQQQDVRLSSVAITTNSKGMAQTTVKLYEGVSEGEVQRLSDLAYLAYERMLARLGARANFS